jgi:hypothetical protein
MKAGGRTNPFQLRRELIDRIAKKSHELLQDATTLSKATFCYRLTPLDFVAERGSILVPVATIKGLTVWEGLWSYESKPIPLAPQHLCLYFCGFFAGDAIIALKAKGEKGRELRRSAYAPIDTDCELSRLSTSMLQAILEGLEVLHQRVRERLNAIRYFEAEAEKELMDKIRDWVATEVVCSDDFLL